MKKMKINKLALVFVATVFVGQSTALSVASARQADIPPGGPGALTNRDPGGDNYAAEQAKKRAAQAAARKAAAARRAAAVKRAVDAALAAAERNRVAATSGGTNTTTTVGSTSTPSGASADDTEAQAKVDKVEKGNIAIITYVDDPQVDKKGNRDHRLGLVNVKVDRLDGDQKCTNRKSKNAKTNAKREQKNSEGKDVFVKGTVNYRMCNAGKYKVTMEGRAGYTALGKTTSEFTLKNNEVQTVKFVLKKNAKTKKKKTAINIVSPMVASRLF